MKNKIFVYKNDDCWWFDDPDKEIIKEELVLGVPEFIENLTNDNSFYLEFSDLYFENSIKLEYSHYEEEGSIYINNGNKMWFCSVLFKYFTKSPKYLFIKICNHSK